MNKVLSVFTEKYGKIENKILNNVVIAKDNDYSPALAQWDTGATSTCISEEIADKFSLIPIGINRFRTPSGIYDAKLYKIDLVLNNELIFKNLTVSESKIGNQGIDILIGMDVISKGDFSVSNYEGKTQFSFRIPSQEHVDYKTIKDGA